MKTNLILIIAMQFVITSIFSQVNFTGYLVDNTSKKLKHVTVNLYKGNDKVSSARWCKKFKYELDLESSYTMELVKEGFVSKRIAISTFEGEKGTDPFMFVMELRKKEEFKEEQIEKMDTDFPIALIEYKKDKGAFGFDTKYDHFIKRELKEIASN